jgi:peptidoglycan/LPS O-acetylase OafA/YrhL
MDPGRARGGAGSPDLASCLLVSIQARDDGRNAYVDWLRALSLIVVVLWHWAFTIVIWHPDGPHATSPLRFTQGFWIVTWLFQVMPLFFYIGGYVHLRSWERARAGGPG